MLFSSLLEREILSTPKRKHGQQQTPANERKKLKFDDPMIMTKTRVDKVSIKWEDWIV